MRYALAVGTLMSVIAALPRPAGAATGLTSIPLAVGAPGGEVVCSCLNLTKGVLDLNLQISDAPPHLTSLGPGVRVTSALFPIGATADCQVFRTDGGTLTTKHVACSFSSIDSDGNPTVVVPLNQKIHQ